MQRWRGWSSRIIAESLSMKPPGPAGRHPAAELDPSRPSTSRSMAAPWSGTRKYGTKGSQYGNRWQDDTESASLA